MYIDSHCHLTCDELYGKREELISHMDQVDEAMIMCTNPLELERALKLKKEHPAFKVAFGWFPGDAKEVGQKEMEFLENQLKAGNLDVLGEIGLDYYWDTSFNEVQKDLFIRQIELANQYNIPIAIHMRDSTRDCLDILRAHARTPIIFHCFSGSLPTMQECLKMNSLISFAGPLTFKNARHAPECVKACPLDRMLSETDSPYLAPVPMRGKRNEPAYVEYVTKKIAELKEIPVEEAAWQIKENFHKLFAGH